MSAPVETKVKAAGWTALVAGFVVAYVVGAVPALSGLADLFQSLIIAALSSGAAAVAGWLASHTPRPPAVAASEDGTYKPYGR